MSVVYRAVSSGRVLGRKLLSSSTRKSPTVPEVPGLSNKVLSVPSGNVGPGASKSSDYKNPEYFSYNVMSYHQAEVELLKYRLPQPSASSKK